MSLVTIAPPEIKTLADLRKRLGGIPLDRIWFHPAPGTATEKDVIEAEVHENRLCELVDGTLVEKAVGFEQGRLALRLGHLVSAYLDENDLGVCVGADGMMRIAPRPGADSRRFVHHLGQASWPRKSSGADP